jgi:hypothetical protein
MPAASPVQKMKALSLRTPVVRASDAVRAGIPRTSLVRLTESGVVERAGRGLYRLVDGEGYEHPDLVEAVVQVPKGVVVLLSALNFHGIGTQTAWQVWMQLPANYPTPQIGQPPLRFVRNRKPEACSQLMRMQMTASRICTIATNLSLQWAMACRHWLNLMHSVFAVKQGRPACLWRRCPHGPCRRGVHRRNLIADEGTGCFGFRGIGQSKTHATG